MRKPSSEAEVIEVRDLRFNFDDVPKHWHGGRKAVTAFYNAMSPFFPSGERFFVVAVRAFKDAVKDDPKLAAEVAAFCAQEGHHSREHVAYNRMLDRQGFPARALEMRTESMLARCTARFSKRKHLAITCALEHFTSLLGTLVLDEKRALDGAHPTMVALWRWHAAEENEHKAVAFDVGRAVQLSWGERSVVMATSTVIFWSRVLENLTRLMWADGILFSPREWWDLTRFLFAPGGVLTLMRPYLSYYRPSFHPNEHDADPLLSAWKGSFAETPEYNQALRS